jgi:predicted phosphodiesterase
MKHIDLGVLDGEVLLFGGPYGNVQATQAVLDWAHTARIIPKHMICTGDVVAYCGAPAASVSAVRASGCAVIAGNCEVQLAQNADDCGCGFEEGTTCERLSVAWYDYARRQLGADTRAWMADLPDVITFTHHGLRYGVIHGGARDVAEFIWETDVDAIFAREWAALEDIVGPVNGVVCGHSGLPFVRQTSRGVWLNAGVIGMPPHDGAKDTRFAVLRRGKIKIERLKYDVSGAVTDMDDANLPSEYRDALRSGYWPSEDVLPDALRVAVSDRG